MYADKINGQHATDHRRNQPPSRETVEVQRRARHHAPANQESEEPQCVCHQRGCREAVLSGEKFTSSAPRPYVEQESTSTLAADPIVQYMSRKQLEKSIERTKKLMQEAAKKLDFIEAAQYRDEVLKMEELLKEKDE